MTTLMNVLLKLLPKSGINLSLGVVKICSFSFSRIQDLFIFVLANSNLKTSFIFMMSLAFKLSDFAHFDKPLQKSGKGPNMSLFRSIHYRCKCLIIEELYELYFKPFKSEDDLQKIYT